MRQSALYSAALHIAVVTIVYFGVPSLFSTPPVEDVPITVDLVSLEDIVKPKKIPEPSKPVPPPPAKKPPPPPAVPEPPEPIAAPEPPPPPLVKPKPKPKAKAKPKPKPEPKAASKPRARPTRVAPKPKQKPRRPDKMQALLKNLAKRKKERERQQKPAPKAAPMVKPKASKPYALSAVSQRLQAQKLTAMVKKQVAPCWSIPAGVKDAHAIQVGVQIRLNTDGTLRGAPRVVDAARMQSDRSFRVIAESSVRALLNPRCRPLKLPYDQYDIWKDITFIFDPGEALGQ